MHVVDNWPLAVATLSFFSALPCWQSPQHGRSAKKNCSRSGGTMFFCYIQARNDCTETHNISHHKDKRVMTWPTGSPRPTTVCRPAERPGTNFRCSVHNLTCYRKAKID